MIKLAIILLIFGLSEKVSAMESNFCPWNAPGISKEYTNIFEAKCKISDSNFCGCLRENAKSKDNAILHALYLDDEGMAKKDLRDRKEEYIARLANVYASMNYGSSLQKSLFGISSDKKLEGCTGENIADSFTGAIDEYNAGKEEGKQDNYDCDSGPCSEDEVLERFARYERSGKKKARDNYQNCFNGVDKNISQIAATQPSTFSQVFGVPQTQINSPSQMLMEKDSSQGKVGEKAGRVKEMLDFYNKHPKLISKQRLKDMETYLEVLKISSGSTCDATFLDLDGEYSFKKELLEKGGLDEYEKVSKRSIRKTKDKIADSLRQFGDKKLNKMRENFDKLPAFACFNYGQYKTFKSMPSMDMLKAIGTMGPGEVEQFLNPYSNTSSLQGEKLSYLRNNPLLSQIVADPQGRKILAGSLQKFSQMAQGLPEGERMKAYSKFMQEDVKKILDGTKLNDIHQCHELGRNLAAVQLTDNLPPLDIDASAFSSQSDKDQITQLRQHVMACKMGISPQEDSHEKNDIKRTLASNPLIYINGKDSALNDIDPENDLEYKKFNDERCQGFEDFRKQEIEKSCSTIFKLTSKEKCVKKYASAEYSQDLLKSYFDQHPGESSDLAKFFTENRMGEANKKAFKQASKMSNESYQNHELKDYYSKVIAPKLNRPLFATKDDQGSFEKIVSANAHVIDQLSGKPEELERALAQANANQVQPQWAKEEVPVAEAARAEVTPQSIQAAQSAREFLPPQGQLPPHEEVKEIENVQREIKEEATRMLSTLEDSEKKGLETKIEKLNSELSSMKASAQVKMKEAEKVAAVSASAPVITSSDSGQVSQPQSYAPSATQMAPSFIAGGASLAPIREGQGAAYNRALLNTKYQEDKSAPLQGQGRSPASVPEGRLVVSAETMKTSDFSDRPRHVVSEISVSQKSFDQILKGSPKDLEKFLQEAYQGKDLPENGIISLKGENGKEILVYAQYSPGKGHVFKLVSQKVRVERRYTSRDLVRTLKNSASLR